MEQKSSMSQDVFHSLKGGARVRVVTLWGLIHVFSGFFKFPKWLHDMKFYHLHPRSVKC